MESTLQSIDLVIKNFDFKTVRKVMKFLDWKWSDGVTFDVPKVKAMKARVRSLLVSAAEEVVRLRKETPKKKEIQHICGTGGFQVTAISYNDTPIVFLSLRFVLEDWDNAGEFYV